MGKKFLYGLVTLYALLCSCTSKVSDKEYAAKNDSIKKYLDLAGNDTLDIKLRDKYNNKAFALLDLGRNDTLTRYYLSWLSSNYMNTKNKKELFNIGKIHFEKSTIARDTLNLARYYRHKAGYYKNTFVNDSALYYCLKAERFYKKIDSDFGLALVYNYKRQIQYMFDDYNGSYLSSKRAYKYFKESNNIKGQYDNLMSIGNNGVILKDYKNAIIAFEKALEIIKKDSLIDEPGTCLNNLGNAYREQKQFKKAIYYFNLALEDKEMIKTDPTLRGFLLNNISYCKLQLKDYSQLPDMLFEAEKMMIDNEGKKESTLTNIYLSNYFTVMNDTLKSQFYAEKALKIAKNFDAPYYYLNALSNAGSVDCNKASKYIVEYRKIHDSLYFAENNARNEYYIIQLETNDIKQEKDKAINQKWIVIIVSSFIILIIALILIITRQRNKQKELELIQFQQKANEEIYDLMLNQKNKELEARQQEKKRIALELHDGVMNKLASTRMNLHVLRHKRDERTIHECLNHIDEIYNVEQEIRNISHDLSFDIFENNNTFKDILSDFINSQNKSHRTVFKLEMDDFILWEAISSVVKINLLRIVQEACANINKFAEANTAIVTLLLDKENLCLSITDDGKGFDVEKSSEGIGLRNIEQRVKQLSGKFLIQSNDKGVSLNISVPLV